MQAFSSCSEERLLSSYDAWASHCVGFSCCGHVVCSSAVRGLSSCSSGTLEPKLSSCGAWASWIFLDQGSNQCLLHCQADLLPLSQQGNPSFYSLHGLFLTFYSASELEDRLVNLCRAPCLNSNWIWIHFLGF